MLVEVDKKKYLFVSQMSSEPGTDMAWCPWLILAHDEDLMGDPKNDTWRRVDKILKEVPIALYDPETDDYKDVDVLVAEITPALEAKGFQVIGTANMAFLEIRG